MKVGVICPAYNGLKTIEVLLDSCRDQTYPDTHVYIADDCSTDGMSAFLDIRRSWYRNYTRFTDRVGWPGNTNRAAQMAIDDGCDAILIAAADDFPRLDCVEKLVAAMEKDDLDFAIPISQQIGEEFAKQVSQPDATLEMFCQPWGPYSHPWCPFIDKALIRVDVWQAVGGYSTDVTIPERPWGCAEDWEFWIKVFKAGFTNYTVVPGPLYYYVMSAGQLGRGRAEVHDLTMKVLRAKHHDIPWKDPE